MININKIKNYASYFLSSFLPLLIFIISVISTNDVLISIVFSIVTIFLSIFLARHMTKHPMRDMLEGSGVLVLKIDSSGVIKPYIATINQPYININNKQSIFDRKLFFYLLNPQKANLHQEADKLVLEIPKKQHYFVFESYYPTLIFNEQTQTFLDKDALSKFEDNYLVTHNLNYIKLKTEELSAILRDFARYVVEQTRPKPFLGFLGSWWFWILLILLLAGLFIFITNLAPSFIGSSVAPQNASLIITR